MALTNAERQERFRKATLMERQLKADALDLLLEALESDAVQRDTIPLPDGCLLQFERRRKGEAVVRVLRDARMQTEIQNARLRLLHGDD